MILRFRLFFAALSFLYLFSLSHATFGFIERHYKLQEIIDSSTNIVFGIVELVDEKKLRVIIKVEEDVMGKSGLKKIRINLTVGQRRPESTPEKMVKYFHKGKPAVIFYDKHSGQLNSVGYVGGKWFQCKTFVGEGKDWEDRWWTFTHIEIHMHRTFKGETDDLQKRVREILQNTNPILAGESAPAFDKASENYVKILIFSSRKYPAELRTLRQISKIGQYQFAYQITYDPNLPGLEKANILWLGYRSLGEDRYLLNQKSENRIKEFVKNGGVLIASGQDSEAIPMGWFAGRLKGVERETQMGIHLNNNSGDIFTKPNKIATRNIYTEDSWNDVEEDFKVLATINDGRNVAVGMLKYGKGMYLITSLHHETYFQASSNARLIENLIYSAAKRLDGSTEIVQKATDPSQAQDKLFVLGQSVSRETDETAPKNKDELKNRIADLKKRFNAIQGDIDQLEKESKLDEDTSDDELENRIGKLQLEFSAIRKSISQIEKESERGLDKSQLLKKGEAKEKELQSISTEVFHQSDTYKEINEDYKKVSEILSQLQEKINQFNQEITSEFSDSKSDLEAIEKRLERFRKSIADAKSSFIELDLAFEIEPSK